MNLRALIATRREALALTRAALARRLSPWDRWDLPPDSAETALYRFERGRGELSAERLADVLGELGLDVRASDAPHENGGGSRTVEKSDGRMKK